MWYYVSQLNGCMEFPEEWNCSSNHVAAELILIKFTNVYGQIEGKN
jgi:hypothetical protein